MHWRAIGAIGAVGVAWLLAGCGAEREPAPASETRPFRHAKGTTTVPVEPKRVASLNDFFLTANLLDVGFRPAGSTTSSGEIRAADYDVAGIRRLGETSEVDVERVAALEPDLIVGIEANDASRYAALSRIAPTVLLDDDAPIAEFNRRLADLVGRRARHAQRVAEVDRRTAELRERLRPVLADLEVSAISADSEQIFTYYGPGNAYSVAFERLGLRFPRGRLPPSGQTFSLERLREFDADAIFVMSDGIDEDWLTRQSLFRGLSASRKRQVFTVDYDLWTGSRLAAIPLIYDEIERRLIDDRPDASADFG